MALLLLESEINKFRIRLKSNSKNKKKQPKPKVVFVSGNFNVLHPGHQRLIQFAAECGDILVLGVTSDQSNGVLFPQNLRIQGIINLTSVNYVIPIENDVLEVLKKLNPDIVVKGKEHEQRNNIESDYLKEHGGALVFCSGEINFSSIDLLRNDHENIRHNLICHSSDYLNRHHLDFATLRQSLKALEGLDIIVVGDTIIDDYIICEPLGLSQEDPTIVVSPMHRKKFIGGAAIVAAHAVGLGGNVNFVSVVGRDEIAHFLTEHLDSYGVKHHLFEDLSRPTTLKQRYRTKEKTLLRVNELRQHSISKELCSQIIEKMHELIPKAKLLVFSDFNYGILPTPLVNELVDLGLKYGVTMVADSQSSSQIGDISRFKKMKLITPTEREARLGVRDFESGLVIIADQLKNLTQSENVIVTLGAEGLLVRTKNHPESAELITDRLPAFNKAPKDTAGAGDSLLITSSMLLASGSDIWQAAYLGSLAAAVQVSRMGNLPLKIQDLLTELETNQLQVRTS